MDRLFLPFLAVQLLLLISSACAKTLYFQPETELVCPDSIHTCTSDTTCCLLPDGQYGCCMYANAVCCSDNIHCCPTGSYCDVNTGSCDKDGVKFEWSKKAPALYIPKKKVKNQQSLVEKLPPINMEFQQPESIPWAEKLPGLKINSLNMSSLRSPACSVSQTLCKSDSGLSGCCPFPNAVCCDKGQQCCPSGFQCNLKSSKCEKPTEEMKMQMMSLLPGRTLFALRDPTICPDGITVCPENETCCSLGKDSYACCPYASATCCNDLKHCCPHGYTCDIAGGQCLRKQVDMILVKMAKWIAGQMCPDKETTCTEGSTCCPLTGGSYGCCPYLQATCCSDNVHCCPKGYTCDLHDNRCVNRGSDAQSAVKMMIVCPDQRTVCDDTHTCCALSDNTYGCCPYKKAVCCHDNAHCCPEKYHCDLEHERCVTGQTSLPLLKKFLPSKSLTALKSPQKMSNYVMCPDYSECPDRNTCCLMATGAWGCCPYVNDPALPRP